MGITSEPQHGVTKSGREVHGNTHDHRKGRINKRVGLIITNIVGTMQAAYVFGVLAFLALPAILTQAFNLHLFPTWLINASLISLIAWLSSYFLQLTLLPIIIVGQNAQAEASDARAEKGFEDTEEGLKIQRQLLDMLDTNTKGGLADVMAAIKDLKGLPSD